jgi:hypothetical protein
MTIDASLPRGLILLLLIQESSNLGPVTESEVFHGFPRSVQANIQKLPQIWSRTLPLISSPIHYLSVIQSSDAVRLRFELLI